MNKQLPYLVGNLVEVRARGIMDAVLTHRSCWTWNPKMYAGRDMRRA